MTSLTTRRWLLLAATLFLAAWGCIGLYQGLHTGFTGGLYDPHYTVPGVMPGGPAAKAGFQAGDRVISVEGLPVETLGMESRWPRALKPRIGQTHRFVVERNGQRLPLDLVYEPPFPAAVNNRIRAAIIGLAFLFCGLWVYLTLATAPALILAQAGLTAGAVFAFGLGPSLGLWSGVQGHLSTAASVLLLILMLRFFVMFPSPKRIAGSRLAAWIVYGLWGGLIGFLLVEIAVHPVLYYTTGTVAAPLQLVCILLILAAVAHTFWKTPRAELRQSGMYFILAGLVVSLASAVLPAWSGGLAIAAVPLSMALAVRMHARAAAG